MGWPELAGNGQKIKKLPVTHGGRRRRFAGPIPALPARSRRVRRRLAVKFYGKDRPVLALLPIRCVYSSGGRNRLPRLKPDLPKNGLKRPNTGFSGFGDFLSGFGVGS